MANDLNYALVRRPGSVAAIRGAPACEAAIDLQTAASSPSRLSANRMLFVVREKPDMRKCRVCALGHSRRAASIQPQPTLPFKTICRRPFEAGHVGLDDTPDYRMYIGQMTVVRRLPGQ